MIIDVQHETLETTISEDLGIPYLSKATQAEAREVVQVAHGYIYGLKEAYDKLILVLHSFCDNL